MSESLSAFDCIPPLVYKILLVVATAIWGYSFVVMKDVVAVLPPAWLLGLRFTAAGLILTAILHRRIARAFRLGPGVSRVLGMGVLLGVFDFSAFLTQTIGLQHTTPGINAFLTATYCVIVPFLWWAIAHRRPTVFNIGAAVLAVAGIWLVSGGGVGEAFSLGLGEGMTLLGAFMFAVHIVFVSKFSRYVDPLVLTAIQFVTEGLCGLAVGAAFEGPLPVESLTPSILGQMAFLVAFASIVAFGIQNVALAHVPPAQASLFLSLESVFGVVFSIALYGELVTPQLALGFALIFAAIVVSEVFPLRRGPDAGDAAPASEGEGAAHV